MGLMMTILTVLMLATWIGTFAALSLVVLSRLVHLIVTEIVN